MNRYVRYPPLFFQLIKKRQTPQITLPERLGLATWGVPETSSHHGKGFLPNLNLTTDSCRDPAGSIYKNKYLISIQKEKGHRQ